MSQQNTRKALLELKDVFARQGVRSAVQFLNSLTPHRFTSLFRFDGANLRNVVFFDRENPHVESCEDIPVEASYCVFVRDLGKNFTIVDSQADPRVVDHPKRATVQCYCGVPILDGTGKMFGTICHFDFNPGRITEMDVELLEQMAWLLQSKAKDAA
jgi:GAF domain-containing protein